MRLFNDARAVDMETLRGGISPRPAAEINRRN